MWTGREGRGVLLEEVLPGEFSLFICGSELSACPCQLLTAQLRKAEVQRDGVATGGLSSWEHPAHPAGRVWGQQWYGSQLRGLPVANQL